MTMLGLIFWIAVVLITITPTKDYEGGIHKLWTWK
jgi:hypothetical protein